MCIRDRLVRSGIQLVKYWFSTTDDEQHLRFLGRVRNPDYIRRPVPDEMMVPERY